jgi:hypothetical protein
VSLQSAEESMVGKGSARVSRAGDDVPPSRAFKLQFLALSRQAQAAILVAMSNDVHEIEQAIRTLPRGDVEQLRAWIEDFLEDQLELTDEFKASIERGKQDIADGKVRVREP